MSGSLFVLVASFLISVDAAGLLPLPEYGDTLMKFPKTFGKSAIRQLIEGAGFLYENYNVTTEDGYILNLNRIVNPKRKGADRGYPLLLINGYFMQSEAWMVQPRADTNIATVWAALGYDVWLGDQRGTMRSRSHVNISNTDKQFWDFSFHETGVYDCPAFVDFVLQKTGYEKLIFSCMSLGCSFHAVLASERPSYNDKIKAAIYFVPLVNNIRTISTLIAPMHIWIRMQYYLVNAYEKLGIVDWFPYTGVLKKEIFHLCNPFSSPTVLSAKLFLGSAFHIPKEHMCYMGALSVGGTNLKSTLHVLQVYESGDFAKYDYGREENKKRYGSESAPLYDMSKITSFVAIYHGDADMFASVEGVQRTKESLGGPTYLCPLPNFNHLDVASGTTFRYAFPDVVELLNALSGYKNNTDKIESGKCPSLEWIRHLP